MSQIKIEELVNYCKQYGFIFQGSEIYGGLANTWDYGPLGTKLKNNLKDAWRKRFIQERQNSYEVDTAILLHPKVWEASGHIKGFSDPLIDCKSCKIRHKADNLVSDFLKKSADKMSNKELIETIKENNILCPKCGKSDFTDIREFNLMFETYKGVIKDKSNVIYLRPENAQGEYINYLNILRSMRTKIPFSIGQVGKAFRNEITPGNFIFRTIEFEQMEFQTFCKPKEAESLYNYFKEYGKQFYIDLGLPKEKIRFHEHEKLAHYALAACDIEYEFPFGWGEINGTHNRSDYDLSKHQEYSGIKMEYLEPETNEKYIPYVIESTYGVERSFLALLFNAYKKETLNNGEEREILSIHHYLAPYKATILPLIKKIHGEKAIEIYAMMSNNFSATYDESGSIGKRYRRSDAIGTPFAITIDDDTLKFNTVTVRDRDTMEQEKVHIHELVDYINQKICI